MYHNCECILQCFKCNWNDFSNLKLLKHEKSNFMTFNNHYYKSKCFYNNTIMMSSQLQYFRWVCFIDVLVTHFTWALMCPFPYCIWKQVIYKHHSLCPLGFEAIFQNDIVFSCNEISTDNLVDCFYNQVLSSWFVGCLSHRLSTRGWNKLLNNYGRNILMPIA